jgi:hypothetical protein
MATGMLPPDGELRLGSVTLGWAADRLCQAGDPVAWATIEDVPDAGRYWAALSDAHQQTGLMPFLVAGLDGNTSPPWDWGEFFGPPADTAELDHMARRPQQRARQPVTRQPPVPLIPAGPAWPARPLPCCSATRPALAGRPPPAETAVAGRAGRCPGQQWVCPVRLFVPFEPQNAVGHRRLSTPGGLPRLLQSVWARSSSLLLSSPPRWRRRSFQEASRGVRSGTSAATTRSCPAAEGGSCSAVPGPGRAC